jgi:cytosine/adenosine deaminase-related metal-dependent hydrolase
MMHSRAELPLLAQRLVRSITLDAARAIRSDAGRLEAGAPADIVLISLPDFVEDREQLALQTILHTKDVDEIFIDGENI